VWKLDTHKVGHCEGHIFTKSGDVIGFHNYRKFLITKLQQRKFGPKTCGIDANQLGRPIFVVQEDARILSNYENGTSSVNIVHVRDWKRYWYKWFTYGDFSNEAIN
jgi:hypothetical protein